VADIWLSSFSFGLFGVMVGLIRASMVGFVGWLIYLRDQDCSSATAVRIRRSSSEE
jgi:hypothetical protein